jgi:hypothetical protein
VTAVARVSVTAVPERVTQHVKGSEPIVSCRTVPPELDPSFPGRVTGIGAVHLLLVAVTVTAVMVFPSVEVV